LATTYLAGNSTQSDTYRIEESEKYHNNKDDIAIDSSGNVYVTDTDNNRIQVFAPSSSGK
jgi:hypothetical protein